MASNRGSLAGLLLSLKCINLTNNPFNGTLPSKIGFLWQLVEALIVANSTELTSLGPIEMGL
jgi:hypothetical protein